MIKKYASEIIKKGSKNIPEDIIMLNLMERFSWSYKDYINTPYYLVDLIIQKDGIEEKFNKLKDNNGDK